MAAIDRGANAADAMVVVLIISPRLIMFFIVIVEVGAAVVGLPHSLCRKHCILLWPLYGLAGRRARLSG
jgi:hypothetical protein